MNLDDLCSTASVDVNVPTRHFMMVRYILEGYDGLAYASTVPRTHDCLCVYCYQSALPAVLDLLKSLSSELSLTVTAVRGSGVPNHLPSTQSPPSGLGSAPAL